MSRTNNSRLPWALTLLILISLLASCRGQSLTRRTPSSGMLQRTGQAPALSTSQSHTSTATSGVQTTQEAQATMWLPPTQTPTPSSLPDYSIPSPTGLPATGPGGGPPDSSAITRILIPAINLDTVVKFVPFEGQTWLIGGLRQEVAWMGDTSWPGLGGNTGLAGHVDLADGSEGPFWNLHQLKPGDEVILHAGGKVYRYKVRQQVEVDESDLSVVAPSTEPQVTLITCTGWDAGVRAYLRRLIVFADFVSVSAQ